jgi:hypothetical protein
MIFFKDYYYFHLFSHGRILYFSTSRHVRRPVATMVRVVGNNVKMKEDIKIILLRSITYFTQSDSRDVFVDHSRVTH